MSITAVSQNNTKSKPQLFDLDNSANFYTATKTKNWNQVFRVSAVIKQDVNPDILSQAIFDLQELFPTFYVQLKTGFFKYKLRSVKDIKFLETEKDYPCRPISIKNCQKPLFRVLYLQKRISVEFFHVLTDGSGALIYLKNLLARYFELSGCRIENSHGILNINEIAKKSKYEDSFRELFNFKDKRVSRAEDSAYQYEVVRRNDQDKDYFNVIHGLIPVEEIKKVSKAKNVTLTEYLAALYIYAFYQNMLQDKSKKPIKIAIPADLRRLFGSETVRNFSLYTNIGIYPRKRNYTFDEILAEIVPGIREGLDKEKLRRIACNNVSDCNLLVFRFAPVFIKNLALKLGSAVYGTNLITSSLSNLGIVTVPEGMEGQIDHFEFMIGETLVNLINCAAISYNNILNVTFTSKSKSADVQRLFFTFLSEQGVNVNIQRNADE